MNNVRRIVHPKLGPFHFQITTYYLSDANYPTDNPSQTDTPSLVWIRPTNIPADKCDAYTRMRTPWDENYLSYASKWAFWLFKKVTPIKCMCFVFHRTNFCRSRSVDRVKKQEDINSHGENHVQTTHVKKKTADVSSIRFLRGTRVLLENIPFVKFIKTTFGTRVVYFP